jgi:hemolysin-activating ACP:hemolysin acyltransferase
MARLAVSGDRRHPLEKQERPQNAASQSDSERAVTRDLRLLSQDTRFDLGDAYKVLGMSMSLIASLGFGNNTLDATLQMLNQPLSLNQIDVLIDKKGRAMGVAVWAFFDDVAVVEYTRATRLVIPTGDWNGGDRLTFTLFACRPGLAVSFSRLLAARISASHPDAFSRARKSREVQEWRKHSRWKNNEAQNVSP